MLVELSIRNFAIIEFLRLQFGPGFTVFTGETGAGKSIIIDAVGLLLGGRASSDVVRAGCESAQVEGVFVPPPETWRTLRPLLEELGLIEEDSEELILTREVSRARRNICRVNGRAVTLGTLQQIGRHLVDIHGQGEHLSLLQVRHHVDFLDRFAGLMPQRQAFGELVRQLRKVRAQLQALRQDERELARRMDLLRYQIAEIRAAKLQPGEEEELRRQRMLLANAERRMELASELYALLVEGEEGSSASDLLGLAVESLEALAKLDEALASEHQALEEIFYNLEELGRTIRNYREEIEYNPEQLSEVEERLELIQGLKRKYGDSIEEVLAFAERAEEELEGITHSEERIEELQAEEKRLQEELAKLGEALHNARKEAAERLAQAIEAELAELHMERARFAVDIRWQEDSQGVEIAGRRYAFTTSGFDRVEFLIAPNPGEEPKPLAKIASGGEASRLMLAMKTVLSASDPVPTLIFDEIDTGIGGRTGSVVGHKLWQLAKEHQVFCVTHLPQIACYGQQHIRVAKEVVGGRTISNAQVLSPEERLRELAAMLGGVVTDASLQSAEELLQRVSSAAAQKG